LFNSAVAIFSHRFVFLSHLLSVTMMTRSRWNEEERFYSGFGVGDDGGVAVLRKKIETLVIYKDGPGDPFVFTQTGISSNRVWSLEILTDPEGLMDA
jgi:hypothetical protein